MMPNSKNQRSERGGKRLRADDLRHLKRVPVAESPTARTVPVPSDSPRTTDGVMGNVGSEGWVLPGQNRPVSSQHDWVEPGQSDDQEAGHDDDADWRQFRFGAQPSGALDDAGSPPNHLKRFVAYVIDAVIILVLLSLAYPALLDQPYVDIEEIMELMELSVSGADSAEVTTSSDSEPTRSYSFLLLSVSASTLLNLMAYVLYHGVLLGLTGTTVGKRLMGIVVRNADGRPVGVPRAIVRSIGVFLTTILGSIGFIFVLFNPRRRALHDLLAGSYPVEPGRRLEQAGPDQS